MEKKQSVNLGVVPQKEKQFTDLPMGTQKKIRDEYMRKMRSHPNMSRERLLKMVGKKFQINFQIEE